MTFSHDSIEVPFPGIYEALEMLESGVWKYFCMDYGQCKFIQAAYDKKEGFTVEAQNGEKSDLTAHSAESKEEAIRLIREASRYYGESPKKKKAEKPTEPTVVKTILPHLQISVFPVAIYLILLACLGLASWQHLLGSLCFFMWSLAVYNWLFIAMKSGVFNWREGRTSLEEHPVAFFVKSMVVASVVAGSFGVSIYCLNN